MTRFFPAADEGPGDLERRCVVLETLIEDLLRRLADAENKARAVAQKVGSVRAAGGS